MDDQAYLDALLTLPNLYNPQVSPDGRWVAWSWFRTGPAANVYVAPTDGSAAPLRLTDTEDHTIIVAWTPDSRALLLRQDQRGDERFTIYLVAIDRPGVMTALTDPAPNYFLRGGQLHPDGHLLVYAANFDVATGQEIEPTWVYRHDLASGERRVLARPLRPTFVNPELNAQGSHILYSRADLHPAGQQIWLVDIEGHEDREILNFGPELKVDAAWLPDGRRVLFLAEAGSYRRVGLWDSADDSIRWLLDDPARNIEAAWAPTGATNGLAVVLEIKQAGIIPSLLDVESGAALRLPPVAGNLVPLHQAAGGGWVGQYYSATQPNDLVLFNPSDPQPDQFVSLTRIWERGTLRPQDFTPAEDFHWLGSDGLEIQGWLYRTPGAACGTVVYVHGGPTSHSEDAPNSQIQFFVRRGFNVLDPNYRGSTGFNLQYMEAIKEDGWGGREQDDIRTGIEALIVAGIAEAGKVGITGTSYGGYSSWYAITHWSREVLAAAAPICGMTDLVVDYETTRPDLRSYSEEMLGGRPDQVPERYHERSPINFVADIRGDLLIVQGGRDPNVTPENVRAVRAALEAESIPYDLLVFADEGHGIARTENQRTLFLRLADFFSQSFARNE